MKKMLNYSVLAMVLFLGVSTLAHAKNDHKDDRDGNCNDNQAPEVDAGFAISGLTMLGGTLTVLRARRKK